MGFYREFSSPKKVKGYLLVTKSPFRTPYSTPKTVTGARVKSLKCCLEIFDALQGILGSARCCLHRVRRKASAKLEVLDLRSRTQVFRDFWG